MITTDAVIYLSGARTVAQDPTHRSYQTLKTPFRSLKALNDDTLAGGSFVQYQSTVMLIPLVGDIITDQRISPGQLQIIHNPTIRNPYQEELINYLLIGIEAQPVVVDFSFEQNSLTKLVGGNYIGKFDGRRDCVHKLSKEAYGAFVFILEGAFEVQNRLLHPRDGLALWNLDGVEFEALSNEGILLLIEVY